jgi:hypothetical protein
MTPQQPRRDDQGGVLAALAVWAVLLTVAIAVFSVLNALGASSTMSAIIGIPLCVVLLFGAGKFARHIRTRHTAAPSRREAPVVDHDAVERDLWAVGGLGTTWLARGSAYWLRRVLIWLGWAAGTILVTVMTGGVAIGATHTPVARSVVLTVVAVVNVAVLIGVLVTGWPTTARLAGKQSSHRTSPGMGAAAGIGLIGAGPLATALLPVLLLGAAGVMLAMLVFASLPQLPEEKATALRRNDILAKTRRHH